MEILYEQTGTLALGTVLNAEKTYKPAKKMLFFVNFAAHQPQQRDEIWVCNSLPSAQVQSCAGMCAENKLKLLLKG